MAVSLDDLHVFESFQGPSTSSAATAPSSHTARLDLRPVRPPKPSLLLNVTLGIYDEMRRLERLLPASEITAVHPANPGWLITVSDIISAAEGDAVQTRGATPPTT